MEDSSKVREQIYKEVKAEYASQVAELEAKHEVLELKLKKILEHLKLQNLMR